MDLKSNLHEVTKAHLVQSFLRMTFDVIYSISKTYSHSFTYPQTIHFWIEGPAPFRANAQRGQSWPQLFANQWPTDFAYQAPKGAPCAHFGFRSINKYLDIYNGNIPEKNSCHSCQCYLGHWEFDN